MKAGDQVRVRNDPGRIGIISGATRERGGLTYYQVRFPDAGNYLPEDQLELLDGGIPDPLDDLAAGKIAACANLRRTLVHVRLTGRLANLIYSMETTDTDFYAYQFKPVVKLLQSPSTGILVADEVGLGKTIEAGLIWTELRSRFDLRRLLVLCPAFLREKWKRELSRRFGVEAEILGARDVLERLRDGAPSGGSPDLAIIASMQGLRPPQRWEESEASGGGAGDLARFLVEREHDEPLVDLLVIDEAHYLRNPETKTAQLGRLLRKVSEYAVLLSATPVHLKSDDLFHLLNLVDEDMFSRISDFDDVLDANGPLVRARDLALSGKAMPDEISALLHEAERHRLLAGSRQLASLLEEVRTAANLRDTSYVSRLAHRLELVNLLGFSLTRTRKRDVHESRVLREPQAEAVALAPCEAAFYDKVTQAVRRACAAREQREGFLLVTPQRQMASSMPAALRHWQRLGGIDAQEIFEDTGNDDVDESPLGPIVQELVRNAGEFGNLEELWKEDSKYSRLRELFTRFLSEHRGEKIVLFSYFRPTLAYLSERLGSDGISNIVLQGGDPHKDSILATFQEPSGPSVLLSSEVGSEGIDLQFAWVLVNYDLPWNPMRVEQRIGRLDRIGQRAKKIVIWNLFYEDTIDSRIYERLYKRLRIFEESIGALEPILGESVRTLTLQLLTQNLSPDQEASRIEQTAQALENSKLHEEELEKEAAHLVAHGDYILNQVRAARELSRRVTGSDLKAYVTDFLAHWYVGTDLRESPSDPLEVHIGLTAQAKVALGEFMRARRLPHRTRLIQADPRPVRCRFENVVISRYQAAEVINQVHPLVRFVGEQIRTAGDTVHPAVVVSVRAEDVVARMVSPGTYVFAVQKWSIKAMHDQEMLHYQAATYDGRTSSSVEEAEALVMAAAMHGRDWLDAVAELSVRHASDIINRVCLARSDQAYEEFVRDLKAQNADRADVQERALDAHQLNQEQKLRDIAARHEAAGRASLVKATEGRIAALRGRVDRQRVKIAERRVVSDAKEEIAAGIIRVEG